MAAKLWEDTVVTALRDAQWMNCKGYALPQTFPAGFVKLDGNAESALGDLLYSSGERYYLIEVKSERNKIFSEWTDSDGNYKEKLVYSSLKERWDDLESAASTGKGAQKKDFNFFIKSVSCHHIAYWNSWPCEKSSASSRLSTGEVVLEPYMAACLDLFNPAGFRRNQGIRKWNKNDFRIGREINGTLLGARAIPVSKIFHENSRVFAVKKAGDKFQATAQGRLGLPFNEFQNYINAIVDRAGSEALDLHAIVLSSTGTTFKVVSTTEDLKSIFNPAVEPEKSPEQKLEVISPVLSQSQKSLRQKIDRWRNPPSDTQNVEDPSIDI
ncbi:hypothetical protein KWH47_09960 [Xanthomonas campestris pv. spermacoces]|uniref:hypothetical protein n=1 Tax=Xanthomonas euvesicatoria TaxID=456327 RepID=UPI001C45A8A1|nr:hypothetical protein [Xanthomonas euvesicatoria]MBV6887867.1 hypothetical protein [Xanthomonas campestris pv. spermacoces]